jgi:hypothetical protein
VFEHAVENEEVMDEILLKMGREVNACNKRHPLKTFVAYIATKPAHQFATSILAGTRKSVYL